jgi:hypothetical protein
MQQSARLPRALFWLLTGFYLLTLSGHLYSADEETMLAVAQGLVRRGDVAVVVPADAPIAALRPGPDGRGYSPYGVLPSLLALPLVALAEQAAPLGPAAVDYLARVAVSALNAPITAATAALLAAWALRLGASRWLALSLAVGYGLTSFAWPYVRTFFSEPLTALLILIAAERLEACRIASPHEAALYSGIAGLAAGLLVATRIAAGVALPVLGLYVLWLAWRSRSLRTALALCGAWLLGLLPGIALIAWYNWARFGTLLATGYASESGLFTTPLTVGLVGLLFSPGKSIFLYAPLLLLALPGAIRFWQRRRRDLVLLCGGLFLGHLLLYAQWGEWEGGGVWGPRFLLPVVAVTLMLASSLGVGGMHHTRQPVWVMPSLVTLGVLGLIGNLGGVLLNFNTYLNTPNTPDKIWSVAGSPLLAHWQLLGERWQRYVDSPPRCALGDGWFASESAEGLPLPRRSGASGLLRCTSASPLRLAFMLDDRRPPNAPASALRLQLDGRDLGALPSGQLRTYHLLLPSGTSRLHLIATPWNPLQVGFSERDDQLGPQLADLRGRTVEVTPFTLSDTAIAPLPERPRPRWAWYYDPPNQHLVDHWLWYLPRTELAGHPAAWLLGGVILLLSTRCMVQGLRYRW